MRKAKTEVGKKLVNDRRDDGGDEDGIEKKEMGKKRADEGKGGWAHEEKQSVEERRVERQGGRLPRLPHWAGQAGPALSSAAWQKPILAIVAVDPPE